MIKWHNEITKPNKKAVKILIGNKCDIGDGNATSGAVRKVSSLEAEAFSAKHEMKYFETSALNGLGVNEPFEYLLETIMSAKNKGPSQKIVKGGLSFGKGNLADPGLKKILTTLNNNPAYKKSDIVSTVDWL